MRACGRTAGGQVAEQRVCLGAVESEGIEFRQVRLQLDEPTRDGETTVYLLTRWPGEAASAAVVSGLSRYHHRFPESAGMSRGMGVQTDSQCATNSFSGNGRPK